MMSSKVLDKKRNKPKDQEQREREELARKSEELRNNLEAAEGN